MGARGGVVGEEARIGAEWVELGMSASWEPGWRRREASRRRKVG